MPSPTPAQAGQPIQPIGIIDIEGRNGADSNLTVPQNQCLEAYNVDWFRASVAAKRGGASAAIITGGTAFSSGVRSMGRFVPSDDQTAAELYAIDGAFLVKRLAGGTAWANLVMKANITANPQEVNWVPLAGKFYISGKTGTNRMQLYEPGVGVRWAGFPKPATPAAPVTAGGAVTDTRKYRVAWTRQTAGVTIKRSNLSDATGSVALAAQQATVTRPVLPGEDETHWELYAASTPTFVDYRLVATTVVGTATAVDNSATLSTTTAPDDGENFPMPSAKYMVADDSRMIMTGAYETAAGDSVTPSSRRVWWTAPSGSSSSGDDERVAITGDINSYADLEESTTGLSQPMQLVAAAATSLERGSFYVFSYDSHWKFVSTGVADAPYLKFRISGGVGAIHHKSIVIAEDVNGSPAIYWASARGMMRITTAGQEFIGEDVIDIWQSINLDATIPCHAVFHPDKHQVWFWIATGTNNYPNKRIIYDTRLGRVTEDSGVRYGWALHEGEQTKAYCSCLFSNTIAASMSRQLKPYIGYSGGTAVWKCDTDDNDDAGTPFQAYIDTRSYAPWGLGRKGGLSDEVVVVADAAPGVSLRLTIYRNEGEDAYVSDTDLTDLSDTGDADQVFRRFQGSALGDSFSFRCRVGDAQAIAKRWSINALIVPVTYQGDS